MSLPGRWAQGDGFLICRDPRADWNDRSSSLPGRTKQGWGQDDEVQPLMEARVGLTARLIADRWCEEPGGCAGRATVTAGSTDLPCCQPLSTSSAATSASANTVRMQSSQLRVPCGQQYIDTRTVSATRRRPSSQNRWNGPADLPASSSRSRSPTATRGPRTTGSRRLISRAVDGAAAGERHRRRRRPRRHGWRPL